jgi:hypothetical protein
VSVDELEAVPWRGTDLVWRPLRAALGLRAFGAGAYSAERVGQTVVEPHVEAGEGRGHERAPAETVTHEVSPLLRASRG